MATFEDVGTRASERVCAPRDLPDWLIAHGRHWVTLAEVAALLNLPAEQVPPVTARLRSRGQLFSPTPGGYVPVPSEYRSWRSVPASHFIDPLMRQLVVPTMSGSSPPPRSMALHTSTRRFFRWSPQPG